MTLDMKRGALLSEFQRLKAPDAKDPDVGIRGRTLRLVSLGERAIGLQLIQFEIEEGEVEITLEASFEGVNLELVTDRLDQRSRPVAHPPSPASASPSRRRRCCGSTAANLHRPRRRIEVLLDVDDAAPRSSCVSSASWPWSVRTRSTGIRARTPATNSPPRDGSVGMASIAAHEAAWSERWRLSDVEIEGDDTAQQALRFAVYHLNSAANPADERVSIGARSLTGQDYRGHVFWDTEIYLLPFFVTTWPEAARSLLMYRFRRLDGARAKAAGMGWRGALYAWEFADTGAETTPEHAIGPDRRVIDILCGKQEQHISADVAYAVWQYWLATEDEAFFLDAGAEILLETGRFWSSRARLEDRRPRAYPRRHRSGRVSRTCRR